MGDSERPALIARVVDSIDEVPAAEWDACVGDTNPFVSHAFLKATEDSHSATAETGWAPYHLAVEDSAGRVVGVAPMYIKSHSMGEYVFDHAWADALERAGGRYYPKLLVGVPFTPVTGPRLAVRAGVNVVSVRNAMIASLVEVAQRAGVSSLHVNFPPQAEWRQLGDAGFLQRTGCQFHWVNQGYADFEAFLDSLASRKRKAIRRERREALGGGLTIETLSGDDIKPSHWDAFFACYTATSDRKWGYPYLTRDFFDRLGATLGDRVVLMLAARDGRYIAAAFNMIGADTLFGRNWGCLEYHPFLHFELCYYRAIDVAIERGLGRVEAGAQGQHKIARGYLPEITYSAHWIRHQGLRDAIADYLTSETEAIDNEVDYLANFSPFRNEDG